MKNVIALILGGGQGKRLFPLTMVRSKPAVPIGGKYRLIDMPISNCLHSDIKSIYVLTQFNSESLNNHINATYRFDFFSRAFVRILAAEQTLEGANWFQGTADAVRKNILHLNLRNNDQDILILSGDHIYDMDYHELIHFHRAKNADFTVSVVPVCSDEVKELGILKLAGNKRITKFKEKPNTPAELRNLKFKSSKNSKCPYLASMGVYVFKASALKKALEGNDTDFGREVIPHSIKKFKGFGYIFEGYWKDIGTIKSFYEVNLEIAASKPNLAFLYKGRVFTRPRFLSPSRISNCRIEQALITEGCVINDAEIKHSTIGLRSIIGKGCKISKSVIMGSDYYEDSHGKEAVKIGIGDGSTIENAIIDKNARIGKNVIIKNINNIKNIDDSCYYIRDGIVVIPKNMVIKDGTKI
ncbi:MAG: glucose-1-phosphate adenylyltransferase [Candidatus Omnitrophota bacterium]|nr:glucose-1-phosphate adenylyltransferase [Candidatus Omnitrophota bacterium]